MKKKPAKKPVERPVAAEPLGARKPAPAGLSNSEMMRWLRENR